MKNIKQILQLVITIVVIVFISSCMEKFDINDIDVGD